MEIVYRVCCPLWQDIHSIPEHCLCAVSRKNAVAFTLSADLLHEKETTTELELVHRVFVCDLGNPSQVFAVARSSHLYVGMQWNHQGNSLLLADKGGTISIFSMQNGLLNSWRCEGRTKMAGEQILIVSWMPASHHLALNLDRRDAVQYEDKFKVINSSRSVIPSIAADSTKSFVLVTASASVTIGILKRGAQSIELVTTVLPFPFNRHLSVASVTFPQAGGIVLAASDGDIWAPITCCRISAELKGGVLSRQGIDTNSLRLRVDRVPGFSVYCLREPAFVDSPYTRITHVQYVSAREHDILLVAVSNHTDSRVEVWKLKEEQVEVASDLLQVAQVSPKAVGGVVRNWKFHNSTKHHSPVSSIAVSELELYGNQETINTLPVHVAIGYHDAIVLLLNRHLFQSVAHARTEPVVATEEATHITKKFVSTPVHLHQTWSGCGLVCIDQRGDLYLYRLVNCTDPQTRTPDRDIATLLQFSMLAGNDRFDVLMAVNHSNQRELSSVLQDNQNSQLGTTNELLPVLAELAQCSVAGLQEADDLMTHFYFERLRYYLCSVLHHTSDKSPAELIRVACNSQAEGDIDQMLNNIREEKIFPISETDDGLAQSLQHIFQWVTEVCVYVVAVASVQPQTPAGPCSTLIRSFSFLQAARDLLLLMYMWGQHSPGSLPQLSSCNPSLKPFPALFRIISKLVQAYGPDPGLAASTVLQDSFLDECALLVHQIHPPRLTAASPQPASLHVAWAAPHREMTFCDDWPKDSDLGYDQLPLPHILGATLLPVGNRDVIRKIFLDNPKQRCLRCCRTTLMDEASVTNTVLEPLFAFVYLWKQRCICGGPWVKFS